MAKLPKLGDTPAAELWQCDACGKFNVWAYVDYEALLAAGKYTEQNLAIASGSCFDNVCGHCRTNFVRRDSPINAVCYTHRED